MTIKELERVNEICEEISLTKSRLKNMKNIIDLIEFVQNHDGAEAFINIGTWGYSTLHYGALDAGHFKKFLDVEIFRGEDKISCLESELEEM